LSSIPLAAIALSAQENSHHATCVLTGMNHKLYGQPLRCEGVLVDAKRVCPNIHRVRVRVASYKGCCFHSNIIECRMAEYSPMWNLEYETQGSCI